MGKPAAELIGQIFNRLTVIAKSERKSGGKSVWVCRCECSAMTEVGVTHLRSGHTKSCGCLLAESVKKLRAKVDLAGTRNGRLLILYRDGSGDGPDRYKWTCRCDCGSIVRVTTYQLQIGRTESCGCKNRDNTIARNTTHGLSKTYEYRRAKDARRRRQKDKSESHFTAEDVLELLKLQKNKCPCCRKKLKGKFDVDHITALKNGGDNSRLNIQILCRRCNRRKSAKDPVTFMQEQGYLI